MQLTVLECSTPIATQLPACDRRERLWATNRNRAKKHTPILCFKSENTDLDSEEMSELWANRVAVVTGASTGIGARIAVALANAGVIVVGMSRRTELIEDLNKEITGKGKIYPRHCDLSDERSILDAFNWVREKFFIIHILVNNAGIIKANFLTESTTKEMRELLDLNVLATSICLRETLRHMRGLKTKGHIIMLNSILGHRIPEVPVPLFSLYPATKHAITALCNTTRQEIHFLKLNIKLTSISPGLVDTDLLKVYSHTVDDLPKLKAIDVANAVMYALETPEHLQVEEIVLQAMHRYETS